MALNSDIRSAVDQALEDLRAGLVSDGADLQITDGDADASVEVSLVLAPDACQECIVAPDMVESMVTGIIAQAAPSIQHVTYLDPRAASPAGR